MQKQIKCVSRTCHKVSAIYHHKGFKIASALVLLVLVFTLKGEHITLGAFVVRCLDLAADLTAARGLKLE